MYMHEVITYENMT